MICAQADEFERLADADEELAARIRGAPQITVCAAPIACGKADGQLVHDRLARLAAGEALAGRPDFLEGVACAVGAKKGEAPQWQHASVQEAADDPEVMEIVERVRTAKAMEL